MNTLLSNRLKVLRAERNITQDQLAQSCGLSRQSINAIEKGKFIPTVVSALKISKFFKVKIEDIFQIKG